MDEFRAVEDVLTACGKLMVKPTRWLVDNIRLAVCNEIRERDPDVATAFTLYDRELRERLSKKEPVR